ncbi:MAG TPA: patatin-like phospholipase family protein [Acidimicrobiales bacterium]|nr:patatin-like phospholipase family protein [Acidimicrobiales bacterium]
MKTAWVLSGGGAFGAAQVGMARALLEAGHDPDIIHGASAGALNAAWLAADPTPSGVAGLAYLWATVRRRDVFPLGPWPLVAGVLGRADHTVSSAALARWLRSICPLHRLEESSLPLGVVATDLQSGETVLLEEGPAIPALLASAAIPGIFPPVFIEGRWLADGSISSDTSLGPAVAAGAERIWALPSFRMGRMTKPQTALGTLLAASSISISRQHIHELQTWCSRCELYVVPAPVVPGTSAFSFSHGRRLIEAAYELARAWLPTARPVSGARLTASGPYRELHAPPG